MRINKNLVAGIFLAIVAVGNGAYAQKGKTTQKPAYEVKFVMPGLPDSVLYVAYYYDGKTFMFDTLYLSRKEPFTFVMKGDTLRLQRGQYVVASESKIQYFNFIVDTSYFFTIKTGQLNPDKLDIMGSIEYVNSPENALPTELGKMMSVHVIAIQTLGKELKDREDLSEEQKENYKTAIREHQDSIRVTRENFLQENANSLFAKMVRLGDEISIPDPPRNPDSSLVDSSWAYQYYLDHYWDNCDFSESALVRTQSFGQKVVQYFESVVFPIPDTINKYTDLLLEKTKNTPDMFKYIIWYVTQKYERSQYVGHDAVFVHMVKTYYEKGLCPWVDEEVLKAMVNKATRLDKILIGRVAPHLYMPDSTGTLRSNYDFDKKYTIMWFWDLNCGHCKTATPILKEFYDRAKDSLDFEVYAVCLGTDTVKWKQAIIEKELTWVNVGMNTANIDFKEVYEVNTTPVVFILDREKRIIAKKIDAKEIENVMRNHEEGKRIR
ncbi:MAG: DUF5106 domain-containing protein [Lentimicrobiaceae bacterium]|nr:DUF5106 domain-containing protein [Lentimicrobiaceae bacterium]